MVGNITPRAVAESIFRNCLESMNEEELAEQAVTWIWFCESRAVGPWDEDAWHRDCVAEECRRRGRMDLFDRARGAALQSLPPKPANERSVTGNLSVTPPPTKG